MGTVNAGFEYRETIGPAGAGQTLLAYLTCRYRHSSEAEWRERIEAGQVLLDARPAQGEVRLRAGQTLVWRRPPWREPDAPRSFDVLLEDDALLAVAKPAGLPTLPGAGFLESTLLGAVRRHRPSAAPLHRLGRWTSGVVLFACTPQSRRALAQQWTACEIDKRYRALAAGRASEGEFSIDVPIGSVPHARLGSVCAASESGKPAHSRVAVLEQRAGSFLCEVRIATGRPHQIRIHLAAAGHPLVGDPLYVAGGIPADGTTALPGDPGYALHAAALGFRHPVSGDAVRVVCPPPAALRRSSPSTTR
jgi:23S rRNA pseudouridine1911/1915/1917 synthase